LGQYGHTNNWEIAHAINILCSKGYSVDLIDRGNNSWEPSKKYDLFLGLGVGNTGDKFVRYANASGAKKRVLLAMGPQPDISNQRVLERYKMFNQRTGQNAPPMRTVTRVTGDVFKEIIDHTDYIFCIGEKGTQSHNSFLQYNKPILGFYPGISGKVNFDDAWLNTRKRNHFLCFAGNGLICKGVDLVVEAFLKNENHVLHVCGPQEKAFMTQYQDVIEKSNNIFYHGFIEPGGDKFNELAGICSYTLFHSSAEGCCTSVATAMKAGLVPIVNPWTGILIDNNINGMILSEEGDLINNITEKVNYAALVPLEKYKLLVENSNRNSLNYSQDGFKHSYEQCINEVEKNG
jgi:glycosyltransferase involved in cell wall biosynthesis